MERIRKKVKQALYRRKMRKAFKRKPRIDCSGIKPPAEPAKKIESWYDFMSDTFLKLTGATTKFVNGEFADKKEILLAIGSNPMLLDGKLAITPDEWLIPVKNNAKRFKNDLDKDLPPTDKKEPLRGSTLRMVRVTRL